MRPCRAASATHAGVSAAQAALSVRLRIAS
jgi:hypothetical protein